MQKEYRSSVPSKPTEADQVYGVRYAYHEATDPNWSVLGTIIKWLVKRIYGKKIQG